MSVLRHEIGDEELLIDGMVSGQETLAVDLHTLDRIGYSVSGLITVAGMDFYLAAKSVDEVVMVLRVDRQNGRERR